jgi:hypothetical protein
MDLLSSADTNASSLTTHTHRFSWQLSLHLIHQFNFAMSSTTTAIGALVLVPILIAASAAYVAVKTTEGYKRLSRYCIHLWFKSPLNRTESRRRRKLHASDISANQAYADSWVDLESVGSGNRRISTFINQTPPRRYTSDSRDKSGENDTVRRVWHPPRNNRLTWSFADPKSRSPARSGLSNVAKPLPVIHRPERSSTEDGTFQPVLTMTGGARALDPTDH